jgi:hypothetical protein
MSIFDIDECEDCYRICKIQFERDGGLNKICDECFNERRIKDILKNNRILTEYVIESKNEIKFLKNKLKILENKINELEEDMQ